MQPMMYQLLGRLGDICTLLPALKAQHDATGLTPKLVVSAPFASLLDGVSYVEPVVFPHAFDMVNEAQAFAQRLHRDHEFINCTVYGKSFHRPSEMWSFDREVWHRSGEPTPPGRLPLVFNCRNSAREEELFKRVITNPDKPFILAALKGTSSPFVGWRHLLHILGKYATPEGIQVVDISNVVAERPFDLLGLYDRAEALVATDSFPLHLAAASRVPTLALVTDGPTPWHTSSWRPHHLWRYYYSDMQHIDRVTRAMSGLFSCKLAPRIQFVTSSTPTPDSSTARRLHLAQRSRKEEMDATGRWNEAEFVPQRDGTSVGAKPLPFVRDMIQSAADRLRDLDDIICIANADIGVTAGVTGLILMGCQRYGAVFAHRWDFHKVGRTNLTEADVSKGHWYPGSDLFAFTLRWWSQHGHLMPDMLLGREGWDMVMRNLIKKTKGTEIHQAIWHEKHPSLWEQQPQLSGNHYNRRLAQHWLAIHGGHPNDWQVRPVYK